MYYFAAEIKVSKEHVLFLQDIKILILTHLCLEFFFSNRNPTLTF